MVLSENPQAFMDAADLAPIPGVDPVTDRDGREAATLVLWTYNDANPGLVDDQRTSETVEDILSQGHAAWRTSARALVEAEAEIRGIYEGEELPEVFPWKPEPAGHGLTSYRLELDEVEGIYLVHPVWVLD